MKRRQLIATLAAGAALAGRPLPPPSITMSVDTAMEIAQHEIHRRGLEATHHVSALYAGEDRHTQGAAFAVVVRPNSAPPSTPPRQSTLPRLKLLIHHDGRTALLTIPRPCLARS